MLKQILWPNKITFTYWFLTGAPRKQILLPMTGKPMEQASILGFQNSKVKKMLKTWKSIDQVFKTLKSQIKIKHQFSRKPKTAKEKVEILFRCEELKDGILQNENHHAWTFMIILFSVMPLGLASWMREEWSKWPRNGNWRRHSRNALKSTTEVKEGVIIWILRSFPIRWGSGASWLADAS